MLAILKNIFSPQAIVKTLTTMPPVKTTIMDKFFTNRPTHPLAMLGLADLRDVAQTIPVVRRDGTPISLGSEELEAQFFAPLPIKPKVNVSASELNDLKALLQQPQALEAWRARKLEKMRQAIRNTTEAMCSIVLTLGKVDWPIQLEGGNKERYEVDYGQIPTYTPSAKITRDSKLSDLYNLLRLMREKIQEAGMGGKVEYLAGSDVVSVLLDIANASNTTTQRHPYRLEMDSEKIQVGSDTIYFMSEKYPSPNGGEEWVPKLDPKMLLAVAVDQPGTIYYCAIDSISANNAAVPFHVVPVAKDDDTGITLIGNTKPLPVRPSRASCKAIVVD